jgi:hypothetical protein
MPLIGGKFSLSTYTNLSLENNEKHEEKERKCFDKANINNHRFDC